MDLDSIPLISWYMPPLNRRSPVHICIIELTLREKHVPCSIQIIRNKKNLLQSTDCCHNCVLVTCIGTYINRRLIALPMCSRRNSATSLSSTDKTLNFTLSIISDHVNEKQFKSVWNFTDVARNYFLGTILIYASKARNLLIRLTLFILMDHRTHINLSLSCVIIFSN